SSPCLLQAPACRGRADRTFGWILVPETDHRVEMVMLVPHRTEAGRAQEEIPARRRLEPEPARGEHSEEVSAREEKHVALDGPHPPDHAVGSRPDLIRRLASRAAVAEQLPVATLRVDLGAGTTFIGAVVPFREVGLDFRGGPEARELTRPHR